MRQFFGYALLSIFFLLLQTTLVRYLAIESIIPDIILLWVVYLALREGQIAGMTAGFFLGLTLDLLSGADTMLGLGALAKTVAGFSAGLFYNENKITQVLGGYQFLLVTTVASAVHNIIYFLIFLQGTDMRWWDAILLYGLPATLYTVATAMLPMFAFSRKYRFNP